MYHAMLRLADQLTSPQSQSVFICHWLLIMKSSFGHAVSYLSLCCVLLETVVQMNPTVLDWKQAIFIFIDYKILNIISTDKPDSHYRKASQMPHSLPPWEVCYGKYLFTKNRLYQKRKKVLQLHKISSIVTVASTADWKWNTSKR